MSEHLRYMDVPMNDMDEWIEALARKVSREEIASLSGLMLRRLQDKGPTRSFENNAAVQLLSELFGELLQDYGASEGKPG